MKGKLSLSLSLRGDWSKESPSGTAGRKPLRCTSVDDQRSEPPLGSYQSSARTAQRGGTKIHQKPGRLEAHNCHPRRPLAKTQALGSLCSHGNPSTLCLANCTLKRNGPAGHNALFPLPAQSLHFRPFVFLCSLCTKPRCSCPLRDADGTGRYQEGDSDETLPSTPPRGSPFLFKTYPNQRLKSTR